MLVYISWSAAPPAQASAAASAGWSRCLTVGNSRCKCSTGQGPELSLLPTSVNQPNTSLTVVRILVIRIDSCDTAEAIVRDLDDGTVG